MLDKDNRRLRLLTTREDIVLNTWIHIPLCAIILLSLFSLLLSHPYVLSRKLLLLSGQGQGLSTRTQRDRQYQEDLDMEEGTLEQGLPWLDESQPLSSHPLH